MARLMTSTVTTHSSRNENLTSQAPVTFNSGPRDIEGEDTDQVHVDWLLQITVRGTREETLNV